VKHMYPYGAFDIENPKNDNVFKVNEHHLKAYFDNFYSENESIGLNSFLCDFCFASLFPIAVKWWIMILVTLKSILLVFHDN
jgi:hypothetical protein